MQRAEWCRGEGVTCFSSSACFPNNIFSLAIMTFEYKITPPSGHQTCVLILCVGVGGVYIKVFK